MQLVDRWKPWIRAGIWLIAFLVACWVFVAVRSGPLFVSVLGIFAVVEAARRLHDTIRQQLLVRGSMNFARAAWLVVTPLVGAVLFVVWLVGHQNGLGFFGIALFYLGAAVAVAELRRDVPSSREVGRIVAAGSAVVAIVAVLVMAVFGASWAWLALAIALALAPVGIGLLSEVGIDRLSHIRHRWVHWAIPVGGAAVFAGGLWFMAKDVNDIYAYVFSAALLVLMVAIAVRSSADAFLVVAMTGLVWALSNRTVPVPESLVVQADRPAIAALGDSYISGEGAEAFYEGTNTKGDNECRRAPTAYPVTLLEEEHTAIPERLHLVFLACSGATSDGVRSQLGAFEDLGQQTDFDVEFVLVSVGGNDAGFGSIVQTCLLPGDCSELGPAWIDNLDDVQDSLAGIYDDIDETLDDVPVLVVPYPSPLRAEHCSSSGFTPDEHRFLHSFGIALNAVVRQAAADAGFHYVDTMPNALVQERARLCDLDEAEEETEGRYEVGVNFLAANSVVGTLEQAGYPLNWFHNSLHPNEHGHDLMRESLVQWLDRHPNLAPRVPRPAGSSDTDSDPVAAGPSTGPCRDTSDLGDCTSRWRTKETGRLLLAEGWIALMIATGAAMVVLPLVRQARLLFHDNR
ncbi:MAG: SGNH/GDSL hydrolase family protein [Acidimicrobiales bacterium]